MTQNSVASSCIFCRIIRGELPSSIVAQDAKVLAFLDINPVHPGHVLIVPKEHHENIIDTPTDTMQAVIAMSKRVAEVIKVELPCDGMNVSMNNFPASGQVVMHTHMHVIPRFENDGLKPWPHKQYQDGQAESIAARLAKILSKN